MDKSILWSVVFGMVAQALFAVGFGFVDASTSKDRLSWPEEVFRTSLVLCFAGGLALVLGIGIMTTKVADLSIIKPESWIWLAIGAILALLLGEIFFLAGMSAKDLPTVSYTALAFPVFAIAVDLWRGKASYLEKEIWLLLCALLLMGGGSVILVYVRGKAATGQ